MRKTRVVFIGGLTNGKIVYDYLSQNRYVDLALTITYPNDTDKPRFISFPDKPDIIKTKKANDHLDIINKVMPDLIIVAGWSELLSNELVTLPVMGTIGFHPAKLPKDRGRSVLAWQIEEGYTETALTMFYYTDIPDGGDIIAQERIKIAYNDYINDILDKLDSTTYNIMRAYFPLLRQKKAPRIPQNYHLATFRRLRGERDSIINWDRNSEDIYNKIRAISHPYPGATLSHEGKIVQVWKAEIQWQFKELQVENLKPGTVVAQLFDDRYIVKTKNGLITIYCYEHLVVGTLLS